jgi:hypothetical protein
MRRCSCGGEYPWAKTVNGKPVLIEVKPGGNVVLQETLGDEETVATVVKPGTGTHVFHFATCPDADAWRQR